MDHVLGLDSGGTKTLLAVAARDGSIRHVERDRGLDPAADPEWPERLTGLVARAGPFEAAVFGLPCHGESEAVDALQRSIVHRIAGPAALVENDVRIAFDGAFAGGSGVLLLSGTGSMAWAGDGGTHVRVGGWGTAFGDEGSAHWVGREALSLALQTRDGRGNAEALADVLLGPDATSPTAVFDRLDRIAGNRATVAGIARTVDALAEAGDEAATELLTKAAIHLSGHVHAARHRLGNEHLPWSHAGGVFTSRILLRETQRRIGSAPQLPALPPVGGAILRAAILADWTVDHAFLARLAQEFSCAGAS